MRNESRTDFDDWYGSPAPSGSDRHGYVTYTETNPTLVRSIQVLLDGNEWGYRPGYPNITVHECWSGYSEYTVTNTWSEIEIVWGEDSRYFNHVSDFFRALAEADPPRGY